LLQVMLSLERMLLLLLVRSCGSCCCVLLLLLLLKVVVVVLGSSSCGSCGSCGWMLLHGWQRGWTEHSVLLRTTGRRYAFRGYFRHV